MGVEPKKIESLCQDPAAFPRGPVTGTADNTWFSQVLEATDPDPNAGLEKQSFQKKLQEFRSVVDLVHKPNPSACSKNLDDFMGQRGRVLREMPVKNLLESLKILERRAFAYNPETKELTVRDPEALLQIQNCLRMMERQAFQDPAYLKEVDRPELYRLSILVSPKLTPRGRGKIYRVENEGLTLEEFFMGDDKDMGLKFLEDYDGSVPLAADPTWQESMLIGQYAQLHWPEDQRLPLARDLNLKHQKKWKTVVYKKGVTRREWRHFSKFFTSNLFKECLQAIVQNQTAMKPKERIRHAARFHAVSWVLSVREVDLETAIREFVEKGFMDGMRIFEKGVSSQAMGELKSALQIMVHSTSTESRLDNYQARDSFLRGVANVLSEQLKKEGDFSQKIYDPLFGGFVSRYIAHATSNGVPLSTEDFLELIEEARNKNGIPIKIADQPVTWEEVQQKGEMAVTFDAYPKGPPNDWLEDEKEILKRIFYQGVSVYDLARQVVDTVILYPKPVEDKERGIHAAGIAHPLFKTVRVSYQNLNGNRQPIYERLRTIAHEAFHNLEGVGYLKYGWITTPIIMERDAFFFAAYVLKEYLKLRLAHRGQKPISDEEIKKIKTAIAFDNLNGQTANFLIAHVWPETDLQDRTIETPLSWHMGIASVVSVASPKERKKMGEYLGAYPTPKRTRDYLSYLTQVGSRAFSKMAKEHHLNPMTLAHFFLQAEEERRLCEEIPSLQEISGGIFCNFGQ